METQASYKKSFHLSWKIQFDIVIIHNTLLNFLLAFFPPIHFHLIFRYALFISPWWLFQKGCKNVMKLDWFIENLFFPIKVLALNILWLPDGSKLTKVIISASDKIEPQQQHPNIEKIKQIAKQIRNIELLVEAENPN